MENPTLDDLKLLTNDDLVDPEEERLDAAAFVNSLAEEASDEREQESEETNVQEPESEVSDGQEPETDAEE